LPADFVGGVEMSVDVEVSDWLSDKAGERAYGKGVSAVEVFLHEREPDRAADGTSWR
jgi:hypothetical protein